MDINKGAGRVMLVIDVDGRYGWSSKEVLRYSERQIVADGLVHKIHWARRINMPIVFVIFDGGLFKETKSQLEYRNKCIACDRDNNSRLAEFLGHRHGEEFEPVFVKNDTDAFINPELAKYLDSLGAKELLLTGCFAFDCVWATAQGAVRAGFSVNLQKEAVFRPLDEENGRGHEEWIYSVRRAIPPGSSAVVRVS